MISVFFIVHFNFIGQEQWLPGFKPRLLSAWDRYGRGGKVKSMQDIARTNCVTWSGCGCLDHLYTYSICCLKCPFCPIPHGSIFFTSPFLFSGFPTCTFSGLLYIHTQEKQTNKKPPFLLLFLFSSLLVTRCICMVLKVPSDVVNSVMQLVILVESWVGGASMKGSLDQVAQHRHTISLFSLHSFAPIILSLSNHSSIQQTSVICLLCAKNYTIPVF